MGSLNDQIKSLPNLSTQEIKFVTKESDPLDQRNGLIGDYLELKQQLYQKQSLEELNKLDLNKIDFPSKKDKVKMYQQIYYRKKKEFLNQYKTKDQ